MTSMQPGVSPISEAKTSAVKALKLVSKQELTGQLTLRYFNSEASGWRVYFGQGVINYATSLVANAERTSYLISRSYPNLTQTFPKSINDEYDFLASFWLSGQISVQEVRKIIYSLTQEVLIHCLASPPVKLEFESVEALDPVFISASPKEIAAPIRPQVLSWLKLREGVQSPLNRVGVEDINKFNEAIAKDSDLYKLKPLGKSLTQFPTLYALGEEFNVKNLLSLAQRLDPLVQEGQVQVKAYEQSETKKEAPVVACIDDSQTVQKNVKLTLETAGYEVLSITDPSHALSALARKKPALILMDITMPVSGYELSRLLRQSESLAEVPIIMLTGRDGVVDRVRARMVGASEYITKPFNPDQLIQKVQQYSRSHLLRGN